MERRKSKWRVPTLFSMLIAAFLLLTPITLNAEEKEHVITVTETKTIEASGVEYGNDLNITLKNESGNSVMIKADLSYTATFSESYKTPKLYSEAGYGVGDNTKYNITLKAGESTVLSVYVDRETGKKNSIYDVSVTMDILVNKTYDISTDADHPKELVLGESVEGPSAGEGCYKQYYTFTLSSQGELTGCYSAEVGRIIIYSEQWYEKKSFGAGEDISLMLDPGKYYVEVFTAGENNLYFGKTYTLNLNVAYFNWGNPQVTLTPKDDRLYFDVKLTDADPSVDIDMVSLSDQTMSFDGFCTEYSSSFPIGYFYPGYYKFYVTLSAPEYGLKKYAFTYVKKPEKRNFYASALTVSTTSVEVYYTYLTPSTRVEIFKNGKWQIALEGNEKKTIKGLKPDTEYKLRCYDFVPASEDGPELRGDYSQVVTIMTGAKKAPKVKSIKVSKVKRSYVKGQWHPGYWVGSVYTKGQYTPGYYVNSYKVRIKLKSKLAGKKVKGLYVDGEYAKGKGKTFTVTLSHRGKKNITKTLRIASYKDKVYGGIGNEVYKKVKIR